MSVNPHRPFVFSAAALLTVLTSAAAAQEAPSAPDPSRTQPAIQSNVKADDDDDAELVLAEPDFRVLNVPSTLRLPRHGSSFRLTHRFNGNLRQGSFHENPPRSDNSRVAASRTISTSASTSPGNSSERISKGRTA